MQIRFYLQRKTVRGNLWRIPRLEKDLIFSHYQRLTGALSTAVKSLGHVAYHSPPTTEVNNEWIYTSTPTFPHGWWFTAYESLSLIQAKARTVYWRLSSSDLNHPSPTITIQCDNSLCSQVNQSTPLNTQIYTAKHTEYNRACIQAVCTQQRDNRWRCAEPKLWPLDQFLQQDCEFNLTQPFLFNEKMGKCEHTQMCFPPFCLPLFGSILDKCHVWLAMNRLFVSSSWRPASRGGGKKRWTIGQLSYPQQYGDKFSMTVRPRDATLPTSFFVSMSLLTSQYLVHPIWFFFPPRYKWQQHGDDTNCYRTSCC